LQAEYDDQGKNEPETQEPLRGVHWDWKKELGDYKAKTKRRVVKKM
jgi:hypothetical protein